MKWFHLYVLLLGVASARDLTSTGWKVMLNYFGMAGNGTNRIGDLTPEELGQSRGQCGYDFIDYVSYADRWRSTPDDTHIQHILMSEEDYSYIRKSVALRVKCLPRENYVEGEFGKNAVIMIESVEQLVELLKPIGNATKRHAPGSCLFLNFYTPSCVACAYYAAQINALPFIFPSLRIAAIDAMKFFNFNREFGIRGLPSMMLFHQGRPVLRYRLGSQNIDEFVSRHTNLKAVESFKHYPVPLNVLPVPGQPDYCLILAWLFLIAYSASKITKTRLYLKIVEMIKRNWRESEAQLEQN